MELRNVHPVAAAVQVGDLGGARPSRFAMVTAKATYAVGVDGRTALAEPVPLWRVDEPTELGVLPRDDLPRVDPAFEVIALARAHAPGGKPCAQMRVALQVGDRRRELLVTGDRRWERGLLRTRASAPQPFTTMPLTWARAFGGRVQVEIDREALVEVCDVRNPDGRGFDARRDAEALCRRLRSPKGYPRLAEDRLLPNVEDPQAAISGPDDAPLPASWATVPMTSAVHAERMPERPGAAHAGPGLFHRAVPEWVMPSPPAAGSEVRMDGCTPSGRWAFAMPRTTVWADVHAGGQVHAIQLAPQVLILLQGEGRFQLLWRAMFALPAPDGGPRAARIRLDGEAG